jgi:hypothetical protein
MAGDIARVVAGGNQMLLLDYDTGNRAVFGNGTKVYIGANNNYQPSQELVVAGDISASGNISGSCLESTDDIKIGRNLLGNSNNTTQIQNISTIIGVDDNTGLDFEDDQITIKAGAESMITIIEDGAQDRIQIGDGGDIDFLVKGLNDDSLLHTIGSTDRVGIGTSSPAAKLGVDGAISASGTIRALGTIQGYSSFPQISLSDDNGTDVTSLGQSGGTFYFKASDDDNDFRFRRNDNTDVLHLDMSQREIGINTTSPDAALHISHSDTDGEVLKLEGNAPYGATMQFSRGDSYKWRVGVGGVSSANSNIPMSYFGIEDASDSDTVALSIAHSTQNVGIGTTAPPSDFTVEGDISMSGAFNLRTTSAGRIAVLKNDSTSNTQDGLLIELGAGALTTGGHWIEFADTSAVEWAVRGDGSGGAGIYDASDRRLKENIVDISDAMSIVNTLKPRRFNRIGTNSGSYKYGFIADEYADVFPQQVTDGSGSKELTNGKTVPNYQSINKDPLFGILTKAVQELSASNATLATKVAILEAQISGSS